MKSEIYDHFTGVSKMVEKEREYDERTNSSCDYQVKDV